MHETKINKYKKAINLFKGSLLLLVFCLGFFYYAYSTTQYISIDGTITNVLVGNRIKQNHALMPEYSISAEYIVDGQTYTVRNLFSRSIRPGNVGSTIPVFVDPDNPANASLDEHKTILRVAIFALILCIFNIIYAVYILQKSNK
jgi:hypothetical protein